MLGDDVACETFTIISIDSLLAYENKYYVQVYLDNCAYKIVNIEMADYLYDNIFKSDLFLSLVNAVLQFQLI